MRGPSPNAAEPSVMSSHPLSGRVAVVTGASAGIGAACARRLAAQGAALVLGARRVERCEALAAELSAEHGVRATGLALDSTSRASVAAFCHGAEAFAGDDGIALLVNNAGKALGVARVPDASEADEDDWEEMLQTNVLGKLRVLRKLVKGMVARGAGHVVQIGSIAGIETYEGGSVYCASKAGVRIVSKALRMELLGTGVRVSCINPGLCETEFSVVRLRDDEANAKVYDGMTPLTGDDVAAAVEWVTSLPAHVNIEEVTLMPTDQAGATRVHRRG